MSGSGGTNKRVTLGHAGVDWADPQDATAIAEAELLSAANSIEAAARKLTTLKPKLKPKVMAVVVFVGGCCG